MKSFLRLRARAAFVSLLLPLAATAAGYDPGIVAADARWVVHADLNTLRTSALGRELVAEIEKAHKAETGAISINIPKLFATIGSITAYGSNLTPDPAAIDGTLIAQGTADLRKIAESILLQGTLAEPKVFREVTDLPFPAYAISDPNPKKEATPMEVFVAFPPEPIVLVSKSRAQLLKARDVFRGAAPSSKAATDSPLVSAAASTKGAYLFAASVVPTEPVFPEKGPQARILKLARSGFAALGERGEDMFAHLEIAASSAANAEKLGKILEGMMSMLSLAESDDRRLEQFLAAMKVSRADDIVTLRFSYPSARVVELTETLREQAKTRPERRQPAITFGEKVAEWTAADGGNTSAGERVAREGADAGDARLAWRTIDNVTLAHGATISVGRAANGGKPGRIDRLEIAAADGAGTPLTFTHDFMRHRGSMSQVRFPGADGVYRLRVAYVNDPEGKANYAVSVHDPRGDGSKSK